jgi:hypothetical protein
LYEIVGRIRAGLAEFSFTVQATECLTPQAPYSLWLKKRLATWKLQDAREYERPAQEKMHLSGQAIEEYCLSYLSSHSAGDVLSDLALCGALVLRVQSGTNLRCGNLTKDLKWGDITVGDGPAEFGAMRVINTKRLTPIAANLESLVRLQAKVLRSIDDVVTGGLFKLWCDRHRAARTDGEHFFPAFIADELCWGQPLQNSVHNTMVRRCAEVSGCVLSLELIVPTVSGFVFAPIVPIQWASVRSQR